MTAVLAYLTVFVGAVIPWFELYVIPLGVALGLSPVVVGALALAGNGVATVGTVLGWERLAAWWERRRGRRLVMGARRSERAQRAFDRWGVPGVALQGPLLTGIYLAAILALSLGASRKEVLTWSLVSLVVWTVTLVAATIAGVDLLVGRG